MAVLQSGAINTGEYQRSAPPSGAPLPPNVYSGIVVRTAQKETNDRTGIYVEVEFDITSPPEFANRKFWDRFNIVNQSQEASRIGIEHLADLGQAAGFPTLADDEQLVGCEVLMELYIEPAKPYKDKNSGQMREGKPSNKCGKYWPVGTDVEAASKARREQGKGAAAQQAPAAAQKWPGTSSAPQQTTASPAVASATPPWKRNK